MNLLRLFSLTLAVLGAVPAHGATVRVFAAASLREAFGDIGKRFEATHRGHRVEFHFAGSNVLRAQIEQGAAADVYASADTETMQGLRRAGAVGPPEAFAWNRLVVAARSDGPVKSLADLARPGVKVVLAGASVPAGRYAEAALRAMDGPGRLGAGYRQRVLANMASRETNVRAALAKVALGEADAAFVYATDVRMARGKVRAISLPAHYSPAAAYPIARVAGSRQERLADAFIRMVRSREGKGILAAHGFQTEAPATGNVRRRAKSPSGAGG